MAVKCITLLVISILLAAALAEMEPRQVRPVDDEDEPECEVIIAPICSFAGYDNTSLPNLRGHMTQGEAAGEIDDFLVLFQSGCSPAVLHFFCSFYFPFCTYFRDPNGMVRANVLRPCRHFCEFVRGTCEDEFDNYPGFDWPEFLNCSDFPEEPSPDSPLIDPADLCFRPDDPATLTVPLIPGVLTPLPPMIQPTATVGGPTQVQPIRTSSFPQPSPTPPPPLPPVCQRISIDFCQGIGYTNTSFPNSVGGTTQTQAQQRLENYLLFVRMQCSGAFVHFLCAYYVPECTTTRVLRPCKELCEYITAGCRPEFERLNFTWPDNFNCEGLPARDGDEVCSGPVDPSTVTIPDHLLTDLTDPTTMTTPGTTNGAAPHTHLPPTLLLMLVVTLLSLT